MERRELKPVEVRVAEIPDGEGGSRPGVTLRAITPGVVDEYGTVWDAHAFDAELGKRMPTLVWAHDWSEPLGPPAAFRTGDNGPEIDFYFSDFDAVPRAKQAYAQLNDETLQDCSVGFRYLDSKGARARQGRTPTDEERAKFPGVVEMVDANGAGMDELSLVLRGAVPGAKVLSVRETGTGGVEANLALADAMMAKPRMTARLRSGALIDMDAVYEIARKKAAGELSAEEASAAVDLLAQLDKPAPIPEGASHPEADPEPAPADLSSELLVLESMAEGA